MTLAIIIGAVAGCILAVVIFAAMLILTAPELHPHDEDGLSDREREEFRIIRERGQ